MSEKIKIGVAGLGSRGYGLLEWCLLPRNDIEIVYVCDVYEDRAAAAAELVYKESGKRCRHTTDAHELIASPDVEFFMNFTSWDEHLNLAVEAMKNGKAVAIEVGGAYSINECWRLVQAGEESGAFFMMLENCCFGREELLVYNMVRQGIFGELVHCSGGYRHDLREEVVNGGANRHYRLRNYKYRNCENYPTHELGPISKILGINKGNRMLALNSIASKAAGIQDYAARNGIGDMKIAQGDVVNTCIRCAGGETIMLTLDTSLPRPYSRGFHVQGTRAMYSEDNRSIFIDGVHNKHDFEWKPMWNNVEEYFEEYDHELWKKFLHDGIRGGHGGMDWLEFDVMFECYKEGKPSPVDVYDTAAWMSISSLSEDSIAMGGMPVSIPDFTNGKWLGKKNNFLE